MENASVFISHGSDTEVLAEELARDLRGQGMEPWIDSERLHAGQPWREELEHALDKAGWVVILVRPDSPVTPWQQFEWSAVLARVWTDPEKRLLPVVFGKNDPPPFLRSWRAVVVDYNEPGCQVSSWTRRVVDALRTSRGEAARDADLQSREERRQRLDEISRAAEELRQRQPGEPPSPPLLEAR